MTDCKFVRKQKDGWEFGIIRIDNVGSSNERRTYVVEGKCTTYEGACQKNNMAAEGMTRLPSSSLSSRKRV